jgi:hypothetical protein
MGYREYSRYLSFHFPFITERSMLAHLRAVPWRLDQTAYKAWRQGLTGYPLVDAGKRGGEREGSLLGVVKGRGVDCQLYGVGGRLIPPGRHMNIGIAEMACRGVGGSG